MNSTLGWVIGIACGVALGLGLFNTCSRHAKATDVPAHAARP